MFIILSFYSEGSGKPEVHIAKNGIELASLMLRVFESMKNIEVYYVDPGMVVKRLTSADAILMKHRTIYDLPF